MNSTIFVQQTGNIQSVQDTNRPRTQGNAAIVRPVLTTSGSEVLARIDRSHDSSEQQPYSRAVDLEAYVAQIRQKHEVASQPAHIEEQNEHIEKLEQSSHYREYAARTRAAESQTVEKQTAAEIQEILNRIDRAHEEIARKNYRAAMTPSAVAATVPQTRKEPAKQIVAPPLPVAPKIKTAEPVETSAPVENESGKQTDPLNKEELLATISSAIASVLSDIPPARLEQKLKTELKKGAVKTETTHSAHRLPTSKVSTDEIRLQPEVPRPKVPAPHLSFPVPMQPDEVQEWLDQKTEPAAEKAPQSSDVSTTVAAWDVDEFRWPQVTEQILTLGAAAIDELTNYCFDILAPFGGTIAVTSGVRGQGTTTMAMSLSRWATAKGKRVLLVDADLENPSLSRNVGLAPNLSWIEAVRNAQPACEAIIRSQQTQSCIMPQSPIVSRVVCPPNLYDSLAFLIAEVKAEFDLVVIDAGPASQLIAELTRPTDLIDAVLLVDANLQSPQFLHTKQELINLGVLKFVAAQNSVRQAAA